MLFKAWVKFNDMDVECICTGSRKRECGPNYDCGRYIVKFIPIEEEESVNEDSLKATEIKLKKTVNELTKGINKLNRSLISNMLHK